MIRRSQKQKSSRNELTNSTLTTITMSMQTLTYDGVKAAGPQIKPKQLKYIPYLLKSKMRSPHPPAPINVEGKLLVLHLSMRWQEAGWLPPYSLQVKADNPICTIWLKNSMPIWCSLTKTQVFGFIASLTLGVYEKIEQYAHDNEGKL